MEDVVGEGSLACSSPWGHKESDTTGRLSDNSGGIYAFICVYVRQRKRDGQISRQRRRKGKGERKIQKGICTVIWIARKLVLLF